MEPFTHSLPKASGFVHLVPRRLKAQAPWRRSTNFASQGTRAVSELLRMPDGCELERSISPMELQPQTPLETPMELQLSRMSEGSKPEQSVAPMALRPQTPTETPMESPVSRCPLGHNGSKENYPMALQPQKPMMTPREFQFLKRLLGST